MGGLNDLKSEQKELNEFWVSILNVACAAAEKNILTIFFVLLFCSTNIKIF